MKGNLVMFRSEMLTRYEACIHNALERYLIDIMIIHNTFFQVHSLLHLNT